MNGEQDPLSDILRLVQLKACVYFVKHVAPPWGMDAPLTMNGPLHMVLEGACVLRIGGRRETLRAGDAVLIPGGDAHALVDDDATTAEPGPAFLDRVMAGGGDGGGGPGGARILCGHFEWDRSMDHRLFRELPAWLIVRGIEDRPGMATLRRAVDLIAQEKSEGAPGAGAIADRLGEVLFIGLLRAWMAEGTSRRGMLASLADPKLSRALGYIHEHPERPITLGALARLAGMSRTAFALRFRARMGVTPVSYLTEWRMLVARRLLAATGLALAEIVPKVGYGSEAALSRAFKRRFGISPSEARRAEAPPTRDQG